MYETNAQVAKRLGITKRQASKMRRRGKLPRGLGESERQFAGSIGGSARQYRRNKRRKTDA